MGNKLKALVIGTAILAAPVLASTTAEASTTQAAQGKIAAVQVHQAAAAKGICNPWYFPIWLVGHVTGYWRFC